MCHVIKQINKGLKKKKNWQYTTSIPEMCMTADKEVTLEFYWTDYCFACVAKWCETEQNALCLKALCCVSASRSLPCKAQYSNN